MKPEPVAALKAEVAGNMQYPVGAVVLAIGNVHVRFTALFDPPTTTPDDTTGAPTFAPLHDAVVGRIEK